MSGVPGLSFSIVAPNDKESGSKVSTVDIPAEGKVDGSHPFLHPPTKGIERVEHSEHGAMAPALGLLEAGGIRKPSRSGQDRQSNRSVVYRPTPRPHQHRGGEVSKEEIRSSHMVGTSTITPKGR